MKVIGITGGAGFVGQHLTQLLLSEGYKVVVFTRSVAQNPVKQNVTYAHWDADKGECDLNSLKTADAIVHLAGEGIADKRWSDKRKQQIVNSRVKGTNFLVQQIKDFAPDCKVLVSASATGYYGRDRDGAIPFAETAPPATDFLGDTCRKWEDESEKASSVILRLGIVLGKEAGAFREFVKPMAFGVKPILGGGKQMVSWIEVDDLVRMIVHAIEQPEMKGVYNAVAPKPVTHKELMDTIARVKGGIKIPAPVPAFVLKIMLGEMSEEVLKSCTVSAQKVQDAGFVFQYPEIDGAVKAILR